MENEQAIEKGPEDPNPSLEKSTLATNGEKSTVAGEKPTSVEEESVVVRTNDIINIHINESSAQADVLTGIQDSCLGHPSTADALNPNRKRPRDQPEMAQPEHPPSQEPEMAKKIPEIEEEEKATKVAKINEEEDGAEETREEGAPPRHPRPKRRKIAIFVAYCGIGYQGMQRNPGAKTIEGDLEEALFKAGAISPDMYGDPRKVDWMRSARTDKGVSAVGQVVSGRFFIDPPGFVERVNSHLPEQIRVLGYKRVTASFSAKKFCDRRRYEYVIPVFALDPSAHRDRESVLASEGKEGALVKCLECSERGRKVAGLMGRKNENGKLLEAVNNGDLIEKTTEDEQMETIIDMQNSEKIVQLENVSVPVNGDVSCDKNPNVETTALVSELNSEQAVPQEVSELENTSLGLAPETANAIFEKNPNEGLNCSQTITLVPDSNLEQTFPHEGSERNNNLGSVTDGAPAKSSFQYGEKERERFNSILKQFVGTHNFHNLTTRIKAEDPAANRYILSFEASDIFTINGMDFVKCTVVGQSFVLHQIRKMIGLAIAVMRNCAPESIIARSLRKDVHMNVPTAPELGLFLDESFFPAYNQKWQATHEDISLKEFEQQIIEFKQKYIYTHIASTEVKDGVVAVWLHSLNHRNYVEFAGEREAENVQNGAESIPPKANMADLEMLES